MKHIAQAYVTSLEAIGNSKKGGVIRILYNLTFGIKAIF